MGSVLAVLEDVDPPPGGDGVPPLKARILYDPYGQAHVEEGPELRLIGHDSKATVVDGMSQDVLDGGPPENLVLGIKGSIVVATSIALDQATLASGLVLEQWDGAVLAWLPLGPGEVAVARDDSDATRLEIMPVAGWLEGERYRLRLTTNLADAYGRAFVPAEGEGEYAQNITIPAEVEATDDPLPSLPREVPLIFDNAKAAAATLDCDGEPCFPGGLNILFQGAWTDPLTGLGYHRNRWRDSRTASWLSEDPLGNIDSPNLYSLFAWGPHVSTDPMGDRLREESLYDPSTPFYELDGRRYQLAKTGLVFSIGWFESHKSVSDPEITAAIRAQAGFQYGGDSQGLQQLSAEVRKRVTEKDVYVMAGAYWTAVAAPIGGYYAYTVGSSVALSVATKAPWLVGGGRFVAQEILEEAAGPGGVTPSAGVVDDAVSLVDEGVGVAESILRRSDELLTPGLGSASKLITEKLSREASDVLRTEARDIWQQVTGRRAIWDALQIHHRIPLEWSHLISRANPNRLSNLVGVDTASHSLISREWAAWKKSLGGRMPTQAEIIEQALKIEKQLSDAWVFPN